jgi:hypothetical protein
MSIRLIKCLNNLNVLIFYKKKIIINDFYNKIKLNGELSK